jgi:anti-sigma factor RsiW
VLTCREVLDFLMAYVDGELSADEVARFEKHLAVCPSCVNYLASYRATIRAGKAAMRGPGTSLDKLPPDLVKAVEAARRALVQSGESR